MSVVWTAILPYEDGIFAAQLENSTHKELMAALKKDDPKWNTHKLAVMLIPLLENCVNINGLRIKFFK